MFFYVKKKTVIWENDRKDVYSATVANEDESCINKNK